MTLPSACCRALLPSTCSPSTSSSQSILDAKVRDSPRVRPSQLLLHTLLAIFVFLCINGCAPLGVANAAANYPGLQSGSGSGSDSGPGSGPVRFWSGGTGGSTQAEPRRSSPLARLHCISKLIVLRCNCLLRGSQRSSLRVFVVLRFLAVSRRVSCSP